LVSYAVVRKRRSEQPVGKNNEKMKSMQRYNTYKRDGTQSIKCRRTERTGDVSRETLMKAKQSSVVEQ
jgi:hypothetical protein